MKKVGLFSVLALLAALVITPGPTAAEEEKKAPAGDDFVATVNGKGIERAEFERNWPAFLQSKGLPVGHADKSGKVDELRAELLGLLIDQEIMYQEAVHKEYTASTAEVDAEMATVQSRFDSEAALAEALGKNGLTVDIYRNFISRRLTVNNLIQKEIAKAVKVTDEEIASFYNENKEKMKRPEQLRARHILIEIKPDADEETKAAALKRIEEVIAKAKAGEDFAELAKKYSEGPSAPKGGDLGTFPRGRMVPAFEEAAFSLEPGELSGPVLSRFGYHAIKVEEKIAASLPTLDEAKEQISSFLNSTKMSRAVEERLGTLRAEAKVERFL